MIETMEVKAACNGILRQTFPNMKIYGSDTNGALDRPSFYTEIVPYVLTYETVNRVKQSCGFKISLMEKVVNEEFQLTTLAQIRRAFGMKVPIAKRKITVSDIDFDYTGMNNDIFQITISLEWYDSITEENTLPLMEDVSVVENVKE